MTVFTATERARADSQLADLPRVEFELFNFIAIVWFLVEYDHQLTALADNYRRQCEAGRRLAACFG